MDIECLLGYTTVPNMEKAKEIADILVTEKIAACVNIIGGVQSVYCWQDQLHHDSEVCLFIKTTQKCWDKVVSRICELHPYECPAVVGIPLQYEYEPYLKWIQGQL